MDWQPGYTGGFTGVAVHVTCVDSGEVYIFSSINQAATNLGVSRATVQRYLNLIDRAML